MEAIQLHFSVVFLKQQVCQTLKMKVMGHEPDGLRGNDPHGFRCMISSSDFWGIIPVGRLVHKPRAVSGT